MDTVSVRELRNQTSKVLRRVEAGARIVVTVDRRPVAELRPLAKRAEWLPVAVAWPQLRDALADPGLTRDLRRAQPDTTDEL